MFLLGRISKRVSFVSGAHMHLRGPRKTGLQVNFYAALNRGAIAIAVCLWWGWKGAGRLLMG